MFFETKLCHTASTAYFIQQPRWVNTGLINELDAIVAEREQALSRASVTETGFTNAPGLPQALPIQDALRRTATMPVGERGISAAALLAPRWREWLNAGLSCGGCAYCRATWPHGSRSQQENRRRNRSTPVRRARAASASPGQP